MRIKRGRKDEGYLAFDLSKFIVLIVLSSSAAKDALSQFHGVSPEYRCWHLMFKDGCGSLEGNYIKS